MSSPLEQIAGESRTGLALLLERRAKTLERLETRRELIKAVPLPSDVAVVFAGSWGRLETTTASDNDFYLLTLDGGIGADDETMRLVSSIFEQEEYEETRVRRDTEPGKEKTFSKPVVLPHLLRRIGREEDSNSNLTQRMLMVLESIWISNEGLHSRSREAIINGYIELPIKPNQPPRLFLNDVVRYWRTMCVDFAGKMRDRKGQGWGLRNAKLRTSRKILFASGLLPLLRCGGLETDAITPFLLEQFEMPPSDRVADAFIEGGRSDAAVELFEAYERFVKMLDNEETRKSLGEITGRPEASESDLFQKIVEIGQVVETRLLDLLFDAELEKVTRDYAIF
jgi:hypothetical protein